MKREEIDIVLWMIQYADDFGSVLIPESGDLGITYKNEAWNIEEMPDTFWTALIVGTVDGINKRHKKYIIELSSLGEYGYEVDVKNNDAESCYLSSGHCARCLRLQALSFIFKEESRKPDPNS